MSSKKDKFLESAQKFILKGQLDRAIKDYEQVVALDPNDIRHRQRLAELLVRALRKEEAIGEYEAIGKFYADNSYYLKAIAVYKQIQKLDPGNIKIGLQLAILNEKQGLTGNALAEYSRVYSHYEKSGKHSDALTILESMIAIDPENLDTRLKFVETRCAAENAEKAYEDFVQIALLLRKRGDESAFNRVCDRVGHLFPDKKDFVLDLVTSQLKSGDPASAVPALQEVTNREPGNLKAWHLLADALRMTGEREEFKVVLQKMSHLFPAELSPREGLIQCALDDDDRESALFLLTLHGPLFIEKGAYESLERPYLTLLDRLPEDTRLLQGLKNLYEASGAQTRLAGIVARLDCLTQEKVAEEDAIPEEEMLPAAAPVLIEESAESDQEAAWEDEIDISLPADDPGGAFAGALATAHAEPDYPPLADETPPDPGEEPAEIPLELELSEDELVNLAELCNQAGTEESVTQDLPAAMPDLDATEDLPQSEDRPLPGELPLPEDEYIELEAEIFAENEAEEAASAPADCGKYSPDGLFSAFKRELNQQVDREDTETHYNLGIAFKEMGLYDDAIAEFQSAAIDPRRKVDCITLHGICCRDKGDFISAEEIFRQGLALTGLAGEELSPLKYELALLYDAAGRKEEALHLYCEIHAENAGFRDTAEKIAGLLGVDAQEYEDLDLVELDGDVE